MSDYYAPNQQAVRADGSGPAEEGEGASGGPPVEELDPAAAGETLLDLDGMTKEELLDHARGLGVSPANAAMTKDELRAAVEEKQG